MSPLREKSGFLEGDWSAEEPAIRYGCKKEKGFPSPVRSKLRWGKDEGHVPPLGTQNQGHRNTTEGCVAQMGGHSSPAHRDCELESPAAFFGRPAERQPFRGLII